jgi:hypothetical protein
MIKWDRLIGKDDRDHVVTIIFGRKDNSLHDTLVVEVTGMHP